MKKSRQVPLLVIGTVTAVAGCDIRREYPVQVAQNTYANREDCRRDWGEDDRDCRPSGLGGAYTGPRYFWDHRTGYPYAIDPDGKLRTLPNSYLSKGTSTTAQNIVHSSVSRGGFGSTARLFSAGG